MHFYVSGLGTLIGHLTKLSTSVKSSCVVSLFPVAICRKRHFLQINTLEVGKPYLSYAIYHLFSKELSQLRFSFLTLSFCLCCPRRYFQDFENWRDKQQALALPSVSEGGNSLQNCDHFSWRKLEIPETSTTLQRIQTGFREAACMLH